jgi:putative resolvase
MKLSTWAKEKGISYQTAFRMFKKGKLPVRAEQMPTGTILVFEDSLPDNKSVVIYARVSSHDQKDDLVRQIDRLRQFASANGYVITEEISEVASGMNPNRPKLNGILSNKDTKVILVEHKDRLTRFGFELIVNAIKATDRKIIVMNETESSMDLVQDFVDVVTSMCARIYGQRSAKNRASRAIEAAKNDVSE